MSTKTIAATEVQVGMIARRGESPTDLFVPRPDFVRVESVENDGGWVKIRFADGSGIDARPTSPFDVKAV